MPDDSVAHARFAYATAVTSWAASLLLFFTSRALSPKISGAYAKLDSRNRRDWDSRLHSTVHAVLVTAVSVAGIKEFSQQQTNVVEWSTWTTRFCLGLSLGYFVADALLILVLKIGDSAMLIHHGVCTTCLLAGIWVDGCHLYALIAFCAECTTPSVNLRWLLDAASMRASDIYVYNGIALLLGWFLVRVVFFPYIFVHVYQNWEILVAFHPWVGPLVLSAAGVLYALNLFWFNKILAGALKMLRKKKQAGQVVKEE